eukprot:476906-Rhodomonas_salina.1
MRFRLLAGHVSGCWLHHAQIRTASASFQAQAHATRVSPRQPESLRLLPAGPPAGHWQHAWRLATVQVDRVKGPMGQWLCP